MENTTETAAKQKTGSFGPYECPVCRPYPVNHIYSSFLQFIDHLIDHVYRLNHKGQWEHVLLGGSWWYRIEAEPGNPATSRLVPELPPYHPNSPAWKDLCLAGNEKILPEARMFLPEVADWLADALATLDELNEISESSVLVADRLVQLVGKLSPQFQERRDYLLKEQAAKLKDTGMDPKWPRSPGQQVRFVAESMASARWGLTPSTSREFIRQERQPQRQSARRAELRRFGFQKEGRWWEPPETKVAEPESQ